MKEIEYTHSFILLNTIKIISVLYVFRSSVQLSIFHKWMKNQTVKYGYGIFQLLKTAV